MIEKMQKILDILKTLNQKSNKKLISSAELRKVEGEMSLAFEQEAEIKKLISLLSKQDKTDESKTMNLLKKLHRVYVDYAWNLGDVDDLILKVFAHYKTDCKKEDPLRGIHE